MFDEVDKQLEAWAKTISADLDVSFAVPIEATDKSSLCLYLLDVLPEPVGRGSRIPPLQMTLRYLVIPQTVVPSDSHRILGQLLISAMENTEFKVDKKPVTLEIWNAFGLAPRASFVLLVPFKYERVEKLAPAVSQPLVVKQTVLETLQGQVSINRVPMTNANIEIPSLKLFARSDADGNFRFASLPSEPPDKNLLIRVKGRNFTVSTTQAERRGNVYLFDLKLEE